MTERVFVTRKLPGNAIFQLRERYEVDVWENEIPPKKAEIAERAKECVGLISLLSDDIDSELIASLPKLKVIAQYAVGYNNIDIQTATERGILVTNTPGVLTETTADLTWALILSCARRIVESDAYVRKGKWNVAWGPELMLGIDVFKATLGILGMGRIGYAVAQRAIGFDMKILYHSRSETELTNSAEKDLNAERVDLDVLLSEADIISVHVPLTDETVGMIGKDELSKMKPSAILINTSRGPVLNEQDLVEALENGTIAAAGLDVFDIEPLPTISPLSELNNVIVLPHIGSATVSTRTRMAEIAVENLIAALNGKEPPNLVNTQVLTANC